MPKPHAAASDYQPGAEQAAAMQWLREHSQEYIGLWIALRGPELLGTAHSRKELLEQLGTLLDNNLLITRIPDEL